MRYPVIVTLIFLQVTVSIVTVFAQNKKKGPDLFMQIPMLEGLLPDGVPQIASDIESLFAIINGGAEVYTKNGFKRGFFQSYRDEKRNYFNLEIIELDNLKAAQKVFREKTGAGGQRIMLGSEGVLEDYYLIGRQGRFYFTISGPDSKNKIQGILMRIAETLTEQLKNISKGVDR